ncbi:unnamed protein product [Callosobruchus maculatus]|uniref:Uncharacterized protein n=1 Tax=Callosobruchus maculatus TaxID=64391 RepID=A0A653CUU5_CALMS|nr:unnamed protein product [Callosobruchus maculatus]
MQKRQKPPGYDREDLLTIGLILYVYEFIVVQFVFYYFFNRLVLLDSVPAGLGAMFLSLPVTDYFILKMNCESKFVQ